MSEIKTIISNNILPVELGDIPTIMKGDKGDPGRDGSFTQKAYKTYASMLADKASIPANSNVVVNNDPDKSKNAFYTYDGTTFTKGDFDPHVLLTTIDVRLNQAVESASEYFQSQVAVAVDNSLVAANAVYNSAIEANKTYWDEVFTQSVASKDSSFNLLTQRINTDASNLLTEIDGKVSSAINAAIDGVAIDANLVTDSLINTQGGVSQRTLNIGLNSISEMVALPLAFNGMKVFVKGLQGGTFIYDSTKTASNDGGLVFNGWVRDIRDKRITPEMFGAKPNDATFDNTSALNAAFLSGFDIQSDIDSTYHVTGIINSKGQKCLGGWSINSSRNDGTPSGVLGLVKTTDERPDDLSLRMLYVESAYDLTEMFMIKALGFNTINHYTYFENNGIVDVDGSVQQMLDNCLTAGINVILGTESDYAKNNLDAYINNTNNHSAVCGYSVYDEPASRGISIVDQDAKITLLRNLTDKNLSFVDYLAEPNAFNQRFSVNYDIAFVNSYSKEYATGTPDDWLRKDLAKMRLDFGGVKAMTKISRVYPAIAAFSFNANQNFYASRDTQVIRASEIFGKISEGNFAAFVWDGKGDISITDNVRKSVSYQKLCSGLCEQKVRKKLYTDAYIFGGKPDSTDWGLTDLLNNLAVPDPSSTDANTYSSAYPIKLIKGDVENDRTSKTIPNGYSGIGMKGSYSALGTKIKTRANVRAVLEFYRADDKYRNGNFNMLSTTDNGYTTFFMHDESLGLADQIIKLREDLPENLLSHSQGVTMNNSIFVRTDNQYYSRRHLMLPKTSVVSGECYDMPTQSKYLPALLESIEKEEAFQKELSELYENVYASISSITTVKKLLDQWEEAIELLPPELKQPKIQLPALQAHKLNKLIGLPIEKEK